MLTTKFTNPLILSFLKSDTEFKGKDISQMIRNYTDTSSNLALTARLDEVHQSSSSGFLEQQVAALFVKKERDYGTGNQLRLARWYTTSTAEYANNSLQWPWKHHICSTITSQLNSTKVSWYFQIYTFPVGPFATYDCLLYTVALECGLEINM